MSESIPSTYSFGFKLLACWIWDNTFEINQRYLRYDLHIIKHMNQLSFDMIKLDGRIKQPSSHFKGNSYLLSQPYPRTLLILIHHCYQQFDNPPCVIEDYWIHIHMPILFMLVHTINEWQLGLKFMVAIPHGKIILNSFFQIWINSKILFKLGIIYLPTNVPWTQQLRSDHLLYSFVVCGRNIKDFISLFIAHLKTMFHFFHINKQCWPHNKHGDHATQKNV